MDHNPVRQAIVAGIVDTANRLGITTITEGIETVAEYRWLRTLGITLFQGYLFAKPALEALPEPDWQAVDAAP
ncbi:EAL domain-containing protein [Methylothermus subterraneus]